jgi:cell division protein FtsB
MIVAIAGSGGLVFGALRYNREESGKVISQHSIILADMRTLNEELHQALQRTREERDALTEEVTKLRYDVKRLQIILERDRRSP